MDKFFECLSIMLGNQARHLTQVASIIVTLGVYSFVACTDGLKIMINRENDIFESIKNESKEKIYLHFKGLNYHESGHIIFSDFDKLRNAIDIIKKGEFYPVEPEASTPAEEIYLSELKKNLSNKVIVSLFKNLLNIIEDVWMEVKMIQTFPGTKNAILYNEKKLIEQIPEESDCNLTKIHNELLLYARSGKVRSEENFIKKVLPLMDKAIAEDSFDERAKYVNQIILCLYPLIAPELSNDQIEQEIEEKTPDHSKENPISLPGSSMKGDNMEGLSDMREGLDSLDEDDLLSNEEVSELAKILREARKDEEIEGKEKEIVAELKQKEDYQLIITRALPEGPPVNVKQYTRKFTQVLKVLAEDDGEEDELLFGQELDLNSLHRRDGKHFVSYDDKDELSMAICVMIDSSGSMRDDNRYIAAEKCATVLYSFCKETGIPIAIYSHKYRNVTSIVSHAEFDSVDGKDAYRIHIYPGNCNHDAKAFHFAKERIMERTEQIKLLIMISDGKPSVDEVDVAREKIQKDIKDLKKKGITTIAAAIGDDKPSIKRIYGECFVDMSDLSKFPQKMLGIIQSVAGL